MRVKLSLAAGCAEQEVRGGVWKSFLYGVGAMKRVLVLIKGLFCLSPIQRRMLGLLSTFFDCIALPFICSLCLLADSSAASSGKNSNNIVF